MAITFSKSISTTKLLNAYNNNVVEFSSDNILDSTQCTISIGGKTLIITPIANVFRYNFKEVVKILISNKFEDSILPTADLVVDNSLKGSWLVTYTIKFSDTSTEATSQTYNFLKSVEQIGNVSNRLLSTQHCLCHPNLTVFKGYPFDIARFSNGITTLSNGNPLVTGNLTLTSTDDDVERIWLSRGDSIMQFTTPTQDALVVGYNPILVGGVGSYTVNIKMNDVSCGGVYLKWFNNKSGFSYWLFNPIYKEKTTVKTLDAYNVDFESIDNTYATELILGRTATNSLDLNYKNLTTDEMLQLKDILVSPRIEMYNGSYGDAVTSASWQTVKIKSASQIIGDTKNNLINFKLTIEVNQYTQV